MKGVLFTEFLQLIENEFGLNVLDQVLNIAEPKLSTGGAYTSVGTYPHSELLTLLEAAIAVTEADLSATLTVYAECLMARFEHSHPDFFAAHDNFCDFLLNVEGQMHTGVRKLYVDAKPPTLEVERTGDNNLKLVYRSHRPLSVVVAPLVMAAANRYQAVIELESIGPDSDPAYSEHLLRIIQ